MKPYYNPAKQIEIEDKEIQDIIPPKQPYKGPITRSRIKTLEQNDSSLDESRSFFRVHTGYFSNIRSAKVQENISFANALKGDHKIAPPPESNSSKSNETPSGDKRQAASEIDNESF
ncbi:hypothetical protein TNIN_236081 [Trichonephila inaurata madagascariensis]|nr:hypothetical protein TNIN_236081 [Trichonephila inaurata madagascariensis]